MSNGTLSIEILTWWNISLLKKHGHASNAIMHSMLTIDWLNCLISHHLSIWSSRRFWNCWRLIEVHVACWKCLNHVECRMTLLAANSSSCRVAAGIWGLLQSQFYVWGHLINFHENRMINRICLCKHYYWPILLLGQQALVDDLLLEPHVKPSS